MAQEPHAKSLAPFMKPLRDEARAIAKTESYAKDRHVHTSRLWPAKEQAVSKLRVVIEDLDLALDDLEEALTITQRPRQNDQQLHRRQTPRRRNLQGYPAQH